MDKGIVPFELACSCSSGQGVLFLSTYRKKTCTREISSHFVCGCIWIYRIITALKATGCVAGRNCLPVEILWNDLSLSSPISLFLSLSLRSVDTVTRDRIHYLSPRTLGLRKLQQFLVCTSFFSQLLILQTIFSVQTSASLSTQAFSKLLIFVFLKLRFYRILSGIVYSRVELSRFFGRLIFWNFLFEQFSGFSVRWILKIFLPINSGTFSVRNASDPVDLFRRGQRNFTFRFTVFPVSVFSRAADASKFLCRSKDRIMLNII